MKLLTSRSFNRPCLRCQHSEHRTTTCMWNKPEAWLYDCVRASEHDFPYERCMDPVRGTGNYQSSKQTDGIKESDWQFSRACFGALSWRVQEWERKITWHRTLAPLLDVFISHSTVTSIWSYSFTFLTGYILPSGLLPSTFRHVFSWFSVFPSPSLVEKKVIQGRCPSEMAYITQPDVWMFYCVFAQQTPTVLSLGVTAPG